MSESVVLQAPLDGRLIPIDQVPDPVFAGRMVGDGISLDPLSQSLLAPCDGKVATLHPAGHAITLVHASGLEVLVHIGLDTVALKGKGFAPRVAAGDSVRTGQPLIDFQADQVALAARSLLTQMVITNGELVDRWEFATGLVKAGEDPVLTLHLSAVTTPEPPRVSEGKPVHSPPVVIPNPQGLHARPAAVLAGLGKRFQSDLALVKGDQRANLKSVVAILTLQVGKGDTVRVVARGVDAEQAAAALAEALTEGLGEDLQEQAPAVVVAAAPEEPSEPGVIRGVSASPGLAVGRVFQLRRHQLEVVETATDKAAERKALEAAQREARGELQALRDRQEDAHRAGIFSAHLEILDDPTLDEMAQGGIAAGKSAAYAWQRAYVSQADQLEGLKNELLAQRANDLRDVGQRVLRLLVAPGQAPPALEIPRDSILVAEDLTPSDTASLDRSRVLGFCTVLGGATSHVAILARSLDLPAVAAMEARVLEVADNTLVILDATQGRLRLDPSAEELERSKAEQGRQSERRRQLLDACAQPAVTVDGHRVEVAANIGGGAEVEGALAVGAEGVGLLRSEFLFMGRPEAPSEDEQAELYGQIADALGKERTLIIRCLDVGGDKPLPYLPIAPEENPFLGERGIRALLYRPELLRTQFRAILRVAGRAQLKVMLPMITTIEEYRQARILFEKERTELGAPPVPLGIMVEVPATALMASIFAAEADFFSIGTNDLTQYTMAMDRGHPRLAAQVDGLNPAVLRLIDATVQGARVHNRWVGVCGGIAGDIKAVPILVGLGVNELSVAAPAAPAVKACIRSLSLEKAKELAQKALRQESAKAVRELV